MIHLKRNFIIAAAGVCLVWNFILFLFLLSTESGSAAALCSFFAVAGGGLLYTAVRTVFDKYFPIDLQKRRMIFTFGAVLICFITMINTPYSPAHDSHDMSVFLSTFVRSTTLSDYADKYLSFYGTNRICMYFYKPFVLLFDNVQLGSTVANTIFLLTSVFCISDILYKKFDVRTGEISLFLLPAFVPYMMMSGPYIYPPSIFLASIALCLYFSYSNRIKLLSAVFFGILMLMRPTSAMFWIIFTVAQLVIKRASNIVTRICFAIVLILISMCTKSVTSEIMYSAGAYPYPQFTNSAMQWTLELGLRPQGLETGKCTYSAISGQPFDEISSVFHDLWEAYDGADDNETYRIHCLNKKLNTMIADRAVNTVFSSFESFLNHIKAKYTNMFSDEYKAYYYAVNISDDDFENNIYKNYEWRYFLSENVILISFAFSCILLCAVTSVRLLKSKRYSAVLLSMALSSMAVLCGFILLTEVGKRLIFDLYVPMCIVICALYSHIINIFRTKLENSSIHLGICLGTGVLSVCIVQLFYSLYNVQPFKDCLRSYTKNDYVVITLKKPIENDGYALWYPDGRDVMPKGRQSIVFPLKKNDRQNVELTLPNGQIIIITNYEQR